MITKMKPFNGQNPVRKPVTKEEFNTLMFENIGLDLNEEGHVIDDDLGVELMIKGKVLVLDPNKVFPGSNTLLFDPIDNPSIMDKLFKHYVDKIGNDSGVYTRLIAYNSAGKNEKTFLEIIMSDGTVYRSGRYYNDNIKCGDIILQLNSAIDVYDFTELDTQVYHEMQKIIAQRIKDRKKKKKVVPKPKVLN